MATLFDSSSEVSYQFAMSAVRRHSPVTVGASLCCPAARLGCGSLSCGELLAAPFTHLLNHDGWRSILARSVVPALR